MNQYDKDIKAAIHSATQNAADKQDEVWNKIEKQLMEGNMQRKRSHAGKIVAAVIAAGLVITAFTPFGQAAIGKIAELFEPQKNVVVEIEGDQETTDQQLHVGTQDPDAEVDDAMTYVLYVDETRYHFSASDTGDRIVPKDYPTDMPEVYLQITQDKDKTPDDLAAQLQKEIDDTYAIVGDAEPVSKPLSAIRLKGIAGYDWDAEVLEYYLVDNTKGGTFVITIKYFVEAEEGHGARFEQMLEGFQVVSDKQAS